MTWDRVDRGDDESSKQVLHSSRSSRGRFQNGWLGWVMGVDFPSKGCGVTWSKVDKGDDETSKQVLHPLRSSVGRLQDGNGGRMWVFFY